MFGYDSKPIKIPKRIADAVGDPEEEVGAEIRRERQAIEFRQGQLAKISAEVAKLSAERDQLHAEIGAHEAKLADAVVRQRLIQAVPLKEREAAREVRILQAMIEKCKGDIDRHRTGGKS